MKKLLILTLILLFITVMCSCGENTGDCDSQNDSQSNFDSVIKDSGLTPDEPENTDISTDTETSTDVNTDTSTDVDTDDDKETDTSDDSSNDNDDSSDGDGLNDDLWTGNKK